MTIRSALRTLLNRLYPGEEFQINVVPRDKTGDYATNLAMKIAQRTGRPALETAQEIASTIAAADEETRSLIARVHIHPPGFVNFEIRRERLLQNLTTALDIPPRQPPRRILVEFVSANPTGPINIVSARAAAFGDALIRILRATGEDARAEYYVNDSGRQIDLLGVSVEQRMHELNGQAAVIPEDGYHGSYLIEVARQAAQRGLNNLDDIKRFALEYFVQDHQRTMEAFGVQFDFWQRESHIRSCGAVEKVLQTLKDRRLTFEQDGAVYFRSTDFGDTRDRVIVTRDGRYTYLLPDIAYHLDKISRGFELLITVLGPDHIGQVPSLAAGLEAGGQPRGMLKVIIVQEVKIKQAGKTVSMSKRAGTFTALSDLLDKIPADVARFFFLLRSCSQHLDFDLDLAMKNTEENPVYYVQYAHARIQSLMNFAREKGCLPCPPASPDQLATPEEQQLIKTIVKFPEVVEDAAALGEPYLLSYYLIELARAFHFFYDRHRIVTDDPEISPARLFLARQTAATIKRGCELLGIGCPDSM